MLADSCLGKKMRMMPGQFERPNEWRRRLGAGTLGAGR